MFVSVVLPCLNERRTVVECVREALVGLDVACVEGEVIVADNGSTDGTVRVIAEALARNVEWKDRVCLVHCSKRGYGAALMTGFDAARGDVFGMADADGTYRLTDLPVLLARLSKGADMVIGNRFAGGIQDGAMPWSHRYLGVPFLTWLLNTLFGTRVGDAQCGLRVFTRAAYEAINPEAPGMEFASELIARAGALRLHIEEEPTVLRHDAEGRVPHMRSIRDGLRNVRYLVRAWRKGNTESGEGRVASGQSSVGARRQDGAHCATSSGASHPTSPPLPLIDGGGEKTRNRVRGGFTLVELLVVIGIIGVLVAILIPAVQAAREAARRTTCKNQVKQLATGVLLHQEAQSHFPTGGWDWSWSGDPDRGFGPQQPGGWFYNVLPYLEHIDVHAIGSGMRFPEEKAAHAKRIETPIAGTLCPSRRATHLYPFHGPPKNAQIINAEGYTVSTRIDYAISAGAVDDLECEEEVQARGEDFLDYPKLFRWCVTDRFDGISFQQSLVRPAHVTDGLSKTYLLGEKYLDAAEYESGVDSGDNESPYTGVNVDHTRGTSARVSLIPDTPGVGSKFAFGSAHGDGFHMALCDGAVIWVAFDVAPQVHESRGSRNDEGIR